MNKDIEKTQQQNDENEKAINSLLLSSPDINPALLADPPIFASDVIHAVNEV